MGLKINQNINFQTFLVFPAFESQHQHFGVTTSAFLRRDISILALFAGSVTTIFFYIVNFFFFFLLCRDIFLLCRNINNFESRHQHSDTIFGFVATFFFFALSQHKIALLRHCFCSAPVFLLQLVRTITSSF